MTQLVEAGFGIATLPRRAAQRLLPHRELRILTTEPPLPPLPVFASYRSDAASRVVEGVVRSALAFIAGTEPAAPKKAGATAGVKAGARKPASKKSIKQSE